MEFMKPYGRPGAFKAPLAIYLCAFLVLLFCINSHAADMDNRPPAKPVKLIFIHHSTGENWLADNHGGLAKALQKNNYFVSDTNYGWGPDGIGDRTDIVNWPEWFTGPGSSRYMSALFRESGVNSPYRRTLRDPGGENRIVMFKSCFPNSDLEGSPNDSPRRGQDLTVANAKAIYNELLTYFASRPDKLFIVITAPPLQDAAHSRNARAFNNWLVNDWLKGYKGQNVAVFDFYNVLTGQNNHHTVVNGHIQHVANQGKNTLVYPTGSGDDHPSPAGGQKATREFLPLLNAYTNKWLKTAPASPPAAPAPKEETTASPPPPPPSSGPKPQGDLIDNFETNSVPWEAFLDGEQKTKLTGTRDESQAKNGKYGLRIDYQVSPGGWATYSLIYETPQDWSNKKGLSYLLHADQAGIPVILTVHNGRPDGLSHYEHQTITTQTAVKGWQTVEVPWSAFIRPAWEGAGSTKFDPSRAMGLAFVFSSEHPGHLKGHFWIDDLRFIPKK